MLIDAMNDHSLEQTGAFPYPGEKYIGFNSHFSSWSVSGKYIPRTKLSDHDVISGTLKISYPPQKENLVGRCFRTKRENFELMRKDASDFTKDKYFNGYSDNRSVQEKLLILITSFIQESAEKHIPSKTSRSTSSVPWITPEIRRKIRRRNKDTC